MKRIFTLYKNAYSGLPRQVWELAVVQFINRAGSMVIVYLMLYLTQDIGISVAAAGRIISVYGIGAIFGTLLGGYLTDEIGPVRVQLFSLAGAGLVFISLSFVTNIWGITILTFLLALIAEAFRPANSTATADVSPPELRPRAFALLRLAINLGFTIGPVVGGLLARRNYALLFWVDGATCIAAAGYLYFIYRHDLAHIKHIPRETKAARLPWTDTIYLLVLFLLFFSGMIFFQIFNSWPLDLKQNYGFIESQIGPLMAINAIVIILFEMPLVHKLERYNPIKLIGAGAFLIAFGVGLLPFGSAYSWVAFTVVIWTIGEMLCFPLVIAFIANRSSDVNRGKYLGMFSFTFSLSMVISPSLGAWVYETYGPTTLWHSISILGIVMYSGFMIVNQLVIREKVLQTEGT
ncbi:MFS transporter [candidate division KSB1 bacterium]|nr:MFS transporter [candidate division KSB1 bacterium]RQW02701.1 MAG: MFS transporter [candidate division KSB1 bacterium]